MVARLRRAFCLERPQLKPGRWAEQEPIALEPGNPLEHALVAASTDAAARPLFYRLLLESPLLVLDADGGEIEEEQRAVLEPGTTVRAVAVDVGGIPHTAVFSSLAVLQGFIRIGQNYISMSGRDLLNLMRGSHLILNPGAPYGKQILPDEIEAILSGAAAKGYATKVIEKETRIRLGQPSEFPHHLTDALSALFRNRKQVRAAYLALCQWPESGEQRLMIGLDATESWEELMRDVMSTLRTTAPHEIVDIVRMDTSSVAEYMRATRPFYRKRIFGLF